jgi:hypothetical protein
VTSRIRRARARVRPRCLAVPAVLTALVGCGLAAGPAQAVPGAPVVSAVSTSTDSWVTLPMGDLSDPNNTFWELFHTVPGASHWSLATPPGVADNGGLIESASAGTAVVGVLPSQLLRFSPLAQSADGGTSWVPVFLPGALVSAPDALAYESGSPGGAIALVSGDRALRGAIGLSSWSPLVSAATLSRASPECGVVGLDGATLLAGGAPLIATGCQRGGQIGLFTQTATTWHSAGFTLGGSLRGAATTVLRVQSTSAATTVLALVSRGRQRALVALWQSGAAPWSATGPLALASGTSVRSTAVNAAGDISVLLGGGTGGTGWAAEVTPAGTWRRLPPLPARTAALALPAGALASSQPDIEAFTVDGESLGVYALAPPGETWAKVQSSQVPLAYGSSS